MLFLGCVHYDKQQNIVVFKTWSFVLSPFCDWREDYVLIVKKTLNSDVQRGQETIGIDKQKDILQVNFTPSYCKRGSLQYL